MGVNLFLFGVVQIGLEPWRRKRLVSGFEEKVREVVLQQQPLNVYEIERNGIWDGHAKSSIMSLTTRGWIIWCSVCDISNDDCHEGGSSFVFLG
jgi:hypothetical protein